MARSFCKMWEFVSQERGSIVFHCSGNMFFFVRDPIPKCANRPIIRWLYRDICTVCVAHPLIGKIVCLCLFKIQVLGTGIADHFVTFDQFHHCDFMTHAEHPHLLTTISHCCWVTNKMLLDYYRALYIQYII